jgi:polyketide cyclase/dehydrase/lipid transport protein
VRVSASGTLGVDPHTAWAHLVRWERQAAWMADADEVRLLGTVREGVGVRIAVRTRVLDVPAFTEVLEVVRWDPPHLLQIAHTGFVRGAGEWRMAPLAGGRTLFTWTEDLRLPVPVLGALALVVYAPFMRRLMMRSITGLAAEFGRRA